MNIKNLSLILNAVLLLAVAHLYYLTLSKKADAPQQTIMPAASDGDGIKIAYVNVDTLNSKYEWLKQQKQALEKRIESAESNMRSRQQSLMKDLQSFQEKYQQAQSGNMAPADVAKLEQEYKSLEKRQQNMAEEEQRLGKQLAEEQQKANSEMWSNLEAKLKTLQSQIGYDYILAYAKGGGQVLLANDSLEITNQVLELLNANEEEK
jgi:outer membrane protein